MRNEEVIHGVEDSNPLYLEAKKHQHQHLLHIKLCVAFAACVILMFATKGDVKPLNPEVSDDLDLLIYIFLAIIAINYLVAATHKSKAVTAFEKLKKSAKN